MFLSAHWLLYFTAQQLYTHIYMHYTVRIETYKTIWLCPVNTHTHARAAVSKTNILQNVEKWLIHLRNTNITRANANRALLCIGLCFFLRFVFFLIVVFFFRSSLLLCLCRFFFNLCLFQFIWLSICVCRYIPANRITIENKFDAKVSIVPI